MPTAFEKLIADLPRDMKVLDVGYGGLDGENTTNYLRAHFDSVVGINKNAEHAAGYQAKTGAQNLVLTGEYPLYMPATKFDLLVLDLNIEGELLFWTEKGQRLAQSFISDHPNRGIIAYLMTDEEYGDELTKKALRQFWRSFEYDDLVHLFEYPHFQEERRPEITWIRI